MEGTPVLHIGFMAHKQSFKADGPGIGALNCRALTVEFGIETVVSDSVARCRTRVIGNIGFEVAPAAGLAQNLSIEATIGV